MSKSWITSIEVAKKINRLKSILIECCYEEVVTLVQGDQ